MRLSQPRRPPRHDDVVTRVTSIFDTRESVIAQHGIDATFLIFGLSGGGGTLTPLERRKIREEAERDVAKEGAGGAGKRVKKGGRAVGFEDAEGKGEEAFAARELSGKLPKFVELLKFKVSSPSLWLDFIVVDFYVSIIMYHMYIKIIISVIHVLLLFSPVLMSL